MSSILELQSTTVPAPASPMPSSTAAPQQVPMNLQRALGNRNFGELFGAPRAWSSGPPLEEAAPQAELPAAQRTLEKSRNVAQSLASGGANLPPTAYWFAKLYELITAEEIEQRGGLQRPGFLLHFIPFFYELYAANVERYTHGMNRSISDAWKPYFATTQQLDDSHNDPGMVEYIQDVTKTIFAGVSSHVQGDMGTALAIAYNTYHDRYFDTRPFSEYHADFFERNRPVFDIVRVKLVQELFGKFGVPGSMASTMLRTGDTFGVGVPDVDGIYKWRQTAWDDASTAISKGQEFRRSGQRFGLPKWSPDAMMAPRAIF